MQNHFDAWWLLAKELIGASVLTNYGHSFKCGNYYRFMLKYGYLIYYAADAVNVFKGGT